MIDSDLKNKLDKYLATYYKGELINLSGVNSLSHKVKNICFRHEINKEEIDTYVKNNKKDDCFSILLNKHVTEQKMTAKDIYDKADISRQLYSKIMGSREYHPSRMTVIAFGLALELDREEMDQFLASAGYSFSEWSQFDLIIRFFIEQKFYNIKEINDWLDCYDQVPIGC